MKPAAWLKTLASIPKRAWRSRGFGIHSPFAFRFVTTVLRCDASYYAYSLIGNSPHDRRLYRVLLHLAPSAVVRSGPLSDTQHSAIDTALSHTAASPLRHKAVIVPPEAIVGIAYLRRILADGGCVIFTDLRNPASAEILDATAQCGMTFRGLRMGIIVGDNTLPRQQFNILI